MSATDVFLFSLSFLVSGLLAGWVRRLGRDRDGSAAFPARQDPGGELDRLTESLASALSRIEAMERRHEELVRELEGRTGTKPDPAGSDSEVSDSEVSPSQWRSAMDRLGPVWRSGPRLSDPGRRPSSVERGDITEGRDPEPAQPSSRRGAPLDDLFPPPASIEQHAERTAR